MWAFRGPALAPVICQSFVGLLPVSAVPISESTPLPPAKLTVYADIEASMVNESAWDEPVILTMLVFSEISCDWRVALIGADAIDEALFFFLMQSHSEIAFVVKQYRKVFEVPN